MGKRLTVLAFSKGTNPIMDSAGVKPFNRTMPTKPTIPREKAMGIPSTMNSREATTPMMVIARGDNLFPPRYLGDEVSYLENELNAEEESSKGNE